MKSVFTCSFVAILLAAMSTIVSADDAKDEAIKKDHWLIEGTWRVVSLEVNGNKASDEDAKKLSVVNGSDGTWSLRSDGNEIAKGTSTIDPTQNLRTIDITATDGDAKGNHHLGIYENGASTRKLCLAAAGASRPTEFSSKPGSDQILVTFERDLNEAIKIDRQRIEGTWKGLALEIDGGKFSDDDVRNITFVIGADGSWNVTVDGNEITQGASTLDPTKSPNTIDFTPTVGEDKGKPSQGVYSVDRNTLKFCVAPAGLDRPREFSSAFGSRYILISFERMKK
jgi:uncharacterized protein (TIGR03067 family)